MSLQTTLGLWICRSVALIFGILEIRGTLRHFHHDDWSPHAQFHSLTGLSFYLGLTLAFFFITGKPFRNRERWAWWALPLMGLFVHGAQIVIDTINGGLRLGGTSQGSGELFFYLAITAFGLYGLGSFLAWGHFFKAKDPPSA